eukprot:GFUD01027161.1.p1 GENE.GFUD01027161.1~~GFUD01027161.1.p1  ORF type:complete len:689 (-),score=173.90 GFUD01027161.1:484-2550(-)
MANLPDKVLQQRFKIQLESLESPSDLPGGFRLNAEEKNSEYMRVPEKLLQQRFRLQLESLDSPSQLPGGFSDAVMSPMTDLAVNLCDTSLGSGLTPVQDSKRRLSMDSDSTPSPHLAGTLERSLSDSTTPLSSITNKPKRLLLGSGRLTTLKSLSTPRDLGQCNKENIPLQHAILSPNKGSPYKLADSPLGLKPRKSPLGIKQFFSSPSKVPKVSPCKVAPMGRSLSVKRPMFTVLEDEDCNSRDSGFLSQPVEDERLARKKSRQEMTTSMADILSNCSPGKEDGVTPLADSPKDKSPSKTGSSFQTSCSDGFDLDSLSTISEEDDTDSPKMGFNSLFSNPIILPQHLKDSSAFTAPTHTFPPSSRSDFPSNPPTVRPMFRRALSMFNAPSPSCLDSDSPISRNSLVELKAGFKRPDPPQLGGGGGGCLGKKRRVTPGGLMCERSISLQESNPCSGSGRKKPSFVRSHSENELSIMKSCQLKEEVEDILPDSSRLYALPTFASGSKHPSLRSITCETLADVLLGRHKNHVESYRIVDVRYKFEYDGGHIQGAENWQHGEDDQFLSAFLPSAPLPAPPQYCLENKERRNILIFHCEFSSQRGPDFYMKLREKDRQLNKDVYPGLHYPECYLLHLGYKEFYKNFPALCTGSYTEMIDPRHENDLRKMRAKSKSWSGGTVARTGRMGRLHL